MLAKLPKGYLEASTFAAEIRHAFHAELAAAIKPRLNDHIQAMPHETYEQKQLLASWVNSELHNKLGLTIRCPRTDRAAILVADVSDSETRSSRFRYQVSLGRGRRQRTFTSATQLPELELMEDPPRSEPLARSNRLPPER